MGQTIGNSSPSVPFIGTPRESHRGWIQNVNGLPQVQSVLQDGINAGDFTRTELPGNIIEITIGSPFTSPDPGLRGQPAPQWGDSTTNTSVTMRYENTLPQAQGGTPGWDPGEPAEMRLNADQTRIEDIRLPFVGKVGQRVHNGDLTLSAQTNATNPSNLTSSLSVYHQGDIPGGHTDDIGTVPIIESAELQQVETLMRNISTMQPQPAETE